MPIEFDCPRCRTRLRVPDGTEGRMAACPQCTQHVPIPDSPRPAHPHNLLSTVGYREENGSDALIPFAQSTPDTDSSEPKSPPVPPPSSRREIPSPPPPLPLPSANAEFGLDPAQTANPFAAPLTVTDLPSPTVSGLGQPQRVSASRLLSTTWGIFSRNIVHCVLLGLALMASYVVVYMGLMVFFFFGIMQENIPTVLKVISGATVWFFSFFLYSLMLTVAFRFLLQVARGGQQPFDGLMSKLTKPVVSVICLHLLLNLISWLVMGLCSVVAVSVSSFAGRDMGAMVSALGMAVGIGLATCAFLRLSLAWPLIIDGQTGILTSLSMSWRYTRGNFLSMLAAILVATLLGIIAFALTCGIGSIVVMPFMTLGWVVTYLLMTNQLRTDEERF